MMPGNDRTKPMAPADRPALCGARTRQGGVCGNLPMANGRCRFHGGLSTGPRTAAGLQRSRTATVTHGNHTAEGRAFRQLIRELRADARRVCEAVE